MESIESSFKFFVNIILLFSCHLIFCPYCACTRVNDIFVVQTDYVPLQGIYSCQDKSSCINSNCFSLLTWDFILVDNLVTKRYFITDNSGAKLFYATSNPLLPEQVGKWKPTKNGIHLNTNITTTQLHTSENFTSRKNSSKLTTSELIIFFANLLPCTLLEEYPECIHFRSIIKDFKLKSKLSSDIFETQSYLYYFYLINIASCKFYYLLRQYSYADKCYNKILNHIHMYLSKSFGGETYEYSSIIKNNIITSNNTSTLNASKHCPTSDNLMKNVIGCVPLEDLLQIITSNNWSHFFDYHHHHSSSGRSKLHSFLCCLRTSLLYHQILLKLNDRFQLQEANRLLQDYYYQHQDTNNASYFIPVVFTMIPIFTDMITQGYTTNIIMDPFISHSPEIKRNIKLTQDGTDTRNELFFHQVDNENIINKLSEKEMKKQCQLFLPLFVDENMKGMVSDMCQIIQSRSRYIVCDSTTDTISKRSEEENRESSICNTLNDETSDHQSTSQIRYVFQLDYQTAETGLKYNTSVCSCEFLK